MKDGRMIGIVETINANDFIFEHVNVPDDQRAGGEVIAALARHRRFGFRAVIALAADFDGEYGSAIEKLAAAARADIERRVRRERFAIRQVDDEADVIAIRAPVAGAARLLSKTDKYFTRCGAG